jgi:hypothetical protein
MTLSVGRRIMDWHRASDRWAREHLLLFSGLTWLTVFVLCAVVNLVVDGPARLGASAFVALGPAIGVMVGTALRRPTEAGDGPIPDGRVMRWWSGLPGPSKNPDDYR